MIRSLVCTAWFDLARKSLPRPLRPPIFQHQETHGQTAGVSGTKRKRDVTDVGESADTQQIHLKLRTERKRFKNVRVHFTKLPEAPSFRSGRSLSPAAEFGQWKSPIVKYLVRSAPQRYLADIDWKKEDILNDNTGNYGAPLVAKGHSHIYYLLRRQRRERRERRQRMQRMQCMQRRHLAKHGHITIA